jgi:four helix bundle protein
MGVQRYEDLKVWQQARLLCNELFALLKAPSLRRDYALTNQLNTAALSTVANIAEGFLRRSDKDFARFLRIAGASNGETRALLYIAKDRNYLTDTELARLVEMTSSIGRMLGALERHLRTKH